MSGILFICESCDEFRNIDNEMGEKYGTCTVCEEGEEIDE